MDNDQQIPLPAQFMQMAFGYAVSRAMSVAAEFRIADYLKDGPKTADELAQLAGLHSNSVYRLLRALAGSGVFAEDNSGRFSLTDLGDLMRSDHPQSLRGFVEMIANTVNFETWSELSYSVQSGKPAFPHKYNSLFFEWLERNPKEAKVFHDAMTSMSAGAIVSVTGVYDFSGISKLVDVGGGHGLFVASVLSKYPAMRGIVYDDPKVVEGAKEILQAHGVSDRCETMGGNFFESVPAGGDTYVLKHIIHDWSDEECVTILGHCQKALPPGGKVLIIEWVVPGPNVPSVSKLLDLTMMVFLTGRERTEQEYGELLNRAGFKLNRIVTTPSSYSVIEGLKK